MQIGFGVRILGEGLKPFGTTDEHGLTLMKVRSSVKGYGNFKGVGRVPARDSDWRANCYGLAGWALGEMKSSAI